MKLLTPLLLGLVLVAPAVANPKPEPPVAVRTVPPVFPEEMRHAGVPGLVTVSCTINVQGNVEEPKVVKSSDRIFEQPALNAISKWKFKPAKQEGVPVAMRVSIPIIFSVNG